MMDAGVFVSPLENGFHPRTRLRVCLGYADRQSACKLELVPKRPLIREEA